MPSLQQLGSFKLTSTSLVVTDPGNNEEAARMAGLGCFVSPCLIGDWRVELQVDTTPRRPWGAPRRLVAIHSDCSSLPKSSNWQRTGSEIGSDGGLICAVDLAHFHDVTLVPHSQQWTFDRGPANPDDLWYSFLCEAVGKQDATVVPHGFVVSWDGGMDVDVILREGKIMAIRLSISGWPERI
jgi:hypothetical protein